MLVLFLKKQDLALQADSKDSAACVITNAKSP